MRDQRALSLSKTELTQFANTCFQTVHATAQHSQLGFKFLDQTTQFVGDLSDAVEAGVQQRCSLVKGHRPVAAEGAVGITGDAAVLLNQVAQSLVCPVSRCSSRG